MMDLLHIELLLLLLVLGVAASFFSGMETAFFSLSPAELEKLSRDGGVGQVVSEAVRDAPRRTLHQILLADTLCHLPLILVALYFLYQNQQILPFWLSSLALFAVMVGGFQVAPKLIARREPLWVTHCTGWLFGVTRPLLGPMAAALEGWSEGIAARMIPRGVKVAQQLTEEELQTLVTLGREEGTLEAAEAEMILEIMKLADKRAKDVMTPRIDVFGLPEDWSNERALVELRQKRYRHVPVFGETPDEIRGILAVRNFLADPEKPYLEQLAPVHYVPDTMGAIGLLRDLLTDPKPMVVVVDEFGAITGIVSLSDIVEEIVSDAVPRGDRSLYIEEVGDGTLLASGNARLEDLLELGLPDWHREGVDTIGGWLFHTCGQMPRPGERFEIDGVVLTIRRTSRKRIRDLLIEIPGRRALEEEEGEGAE